MSFLAPLFLLGAAAIALPVLFHLVRRTSRERKLFSSLQFLTASPPRLNRRSRLEDLLLLALRCLALALLALGFSRPFLRSTTLLDPTSRPSERVLVLVDTSASMQRDGLWDAAVSRTLALVRAAQPGDEVAVWTFDRGTRPVVSFADWSAAPAGDRVGLVGSRLREMSPGWAGTHAGDALVEAAELLAEGDATVLPGPRRLVLVSDLQDGSHLERLQAFDWPANLQVELATVAPKVTGNAGLQVVADHPSVAATTQAVVRVRIANSADARESRLEVGWAAAEGAGFLGRAEEIVLPAGQSRVVALPVPAGAGSSPDRLRLRGDGNDFDNLAYVVPPSLNPIRTVYLGEERPADARQPFFFLTRALPATGRLAAEWRQQSAGADFATGSVEEVALLAATEPIGAAAAPGLRRALLEGRTLLFAPRTAAAVASLAPVLEVPALNAVEGTPRNYALLGQLDFQHPLLAPFADPRFSDFTKIHFWKYRKIDLSTVPTARVVARFDSDDPAMVEIPVGRGRVILLASGWHPDDSQFGLSTKFVPFLAQVLELQTGALLAPVALEVGDPLPVTGPLRLRLPGGEEASVPAGQTNFTATTRPGIYEVLGVTPARRFAVNLEGAESRTAPLPVEQLESLGAPVKAQPVSETPQVNPERERHLAAVEAESRQKFWRWLIVATLLVLVVESALAAWKSRRLALSSEVPA